MDLHFEPDGDLIDIHEDGCLTFEPYPTEWDLKNICFTKAADNRTFDFTISSLNNSKKYNGTTHLEAGDPKIQRFEVIDSWGDYEDPYEIQLTDIHLLSNEVFCDGYKLFFLEFIGGSIISSAVGGGGVSIAPTVLKTLVG
ncbi:uncharacterized protein LOC119079128 [Bradysia coprophila]|uniref:uncharacterized protein LOC119079128 n=1 Tax=Bradysia coprophila TaxID=38358 RepID=UPI00187D8CDB|nr:uncharacterized protein LOC119079128 [Bradysia coprophila]